MLTQSVSRAQVSDTGVFALQALAGLQRLALAGCSGVGNGAVGALAKITSLQHLDLHWCSFGDKGKCCLTGGAWRSICRCCVEALTGTLLFARSSVRITILHSPAECLWAVLVSKGESPW